MKQTLLVLLLVLLTTHSVGAQYHTTTHTTDTQLHIGLQLSGSLNERWSMNWGEEFYFGDRMSEFQKIYSRVMVSYSPFRNFTISPMVLHIAIRPSDQHIMIYDLNLNYILRFDKMSVTLRSGTRTYHIVCNAPDTPGTIRANPEHQLRAHVGLNYRLNKQFEPYANIETFWLINPATKRYENGNIHTVGHYFPRVRSNIGVKYHIDGHSAVSLAWRWDSTRTKYVSHELMDTSYGIVTNGATTNFLTVFYDYKF